MKNVKKIYNQNKLLFILIILLFIFFVIESFDLHWFAFPMFFINLGLIAVFFIVVISLLFGSSLGKFLVKNIEILILTIIILNFASLGIMNLKKNFIIKQGKSVLFKAVISDIENYKNDTGKYPKKINEVQERYGTDLSKKCFWGMCTEINYFRDYDNIDAYSVKICDEHDTGSFIFTGCGTDYCMYFDSKNYLAGSNIENNIKFREFYSCM